MTDPVQVLFAHDRAGQFAGLLPGDLPGVAWHVAETPEAALSKPCDVAFTINSLALDAQFHRALMAQPGLRWLHVGGSGYDHLGAWDTGRLTVTNSAGVLAPFLAETCLGALLALNHNLLAYRDQQRAKVWKGIWFRPLQGQTLLVVGLGEIGRRFAGLAKAMGMRVIGIRRSPGPVAEADEVRLPEALMDSLGEADVVSLHLRLGPETQKLFNDTAFAAMKPGAMFLNTGRGGLVDEAALLRALDGPLGGAYLDVFETEPLPQNSPLWDHPKLFLTPHASDGTVDWETRFIGFFVDNLRRWQAGEPLVNTVRS